MKREQDLAYMKPFIPPPWEHGASGAVVVGRIGKGRRWNGMVVAKM